MYRSIIHVDMDAFFASIEQKDNEIYRGKPIAVGGNPEERGVVCTASYEARVFGVKSAMPSKRAKQLCSKLIFVPVRMERYMDISNAIREIFERYSDIIEPISIDEAFLDVTGNDPIRIGKEIKKKIKKEIGLTASVGISINKYLAKIASDYKKPDGFTVIKKDEIEKFLAPLSVRKLWGVGPKTAKELNQLGLYCIGDLLRYDKNVLIHRFGKKGLELFHYAKGKDDRLVENKNRRKSIGEENTFKRDTDDIELLKKCVFEHCKMIEGKLKRQNLLVKIVILKVKYEDFLNCTRSSTLPFYTRNFQEIYSIAENILLNRIGIKKKIRLLGVQVSNILYPDEPIQIQMNYFRGGIGNETIKNKD